MKKWYTTREAAEFLGVSFHTVTTWRARGRGPAYSKIGGKTGRARYLLADLDAYLLKAC